jgi:nucleotide-binding universal stress UspA family protein
MMRIERVLHATDFSPTAFTAMKYSLRLARVLNVPIDVIHVVSSIGSPTFEVVDLQADESKLDEVRRNALHGFRELAKFEGAEAIPVRHLLGRGPLPGPVILAQAALVKSNFIVLGSAGQRADEGEVGSVATEIIQRSVCPVFLVPSNATESTVDEKIERVLTYVSYTHILQPLIVFSLQLARLFGAHLDILTLENGRSPESTDSSSLQKLEKRLWEIVEAESKKETASVPYVDIRLHVRPGTCPEGVLQFARELGSDLVVINAPGLVSMDAPFERNAEKIVNQAPCPVVLVNTCGKMMIGDRESRMDRGLKMEDRTLV